ncbi:sodium:proton antiporter [Kosmotoga arenicorallina S304]|uniref:Sodium:proton antiporter n=1 Tax=Kosmotoga arenicorallina S304 TaxID=1453497 RepID=A0A176JXH4_9BACT|nr:hydrogenase subunit MbhD domain-containing protein [Kosmotoga arenicorallina]OAA28427.1 sodium:proton antiporter [Kosmotoga arenicorallina S304]
MSVISFIIGAVLVVSSLVAIEAKKLITSVVMLSLASLLAVVSFVLLKAPDVAITEAAVGAGLTTAIFLLTLKRLGRGESE